MDFRDIQQLLVAGLTTNSIEQGDFVLVGRPNPLRGDKYSMLLLDNAGLTNYIDTRPGIFSWVKITKNYLDFSDPGFTKTINIYQPEPREFIHITVMDPTVEFAGASSGGSILTYTISVGYTNTTDLLSAQDVHHLAVAPFIGSPTAIITERINPSPVTATAISTNDHLHSASQGEVTFWILKSVLP